MHIMCTFARVVRVAHSKNHNSFLAHGGKKLPTTATNQLKIFI